MKANLPFFGFVEVREFTVNPGHWRFQRPDGSCGECSANEDAICNATKAEELGQKKRMSDEEASAPTLKDIPAVEAPVKTMTSKRKKEDPNIARVRGWMHLYAKSYDTSTEAAEACANELNLYENTRDYKIPEYIFEIAGRYLPTK